jgi:DNA-binding CsgD family transcriptional regulator
VNRLDRLLWFMIQTSMPLKQIAHTMKVTYNTVRTDTHDLFEREGLHSRVELMQREISRLSAENGKLKRIVAGMV